MFGIAALVSTRLSQSSVIRPSTIPKVIRHTSHQWRFRPRHDKIDAMLFCERHQASEVFDFYGDILDLGETTSCASIALSDVDVLY